MNRESKGRADVLALRSAFDEIWHKTDQLFSQFGPADWQKPHGKHWKMQDVPFHLSYFDRDLAVNPIQAGRTISGSAQLRLNSEASTDSWNAAVFANRPPMMTSGEMVEAMRESRREIAAILHEFSDEDLEQPVWNAFFGWDTAGNVLRGCLGHTMNHFHELKHRLHRSSPVLEPVSTRPALQFFLGAMSGMASPERATTSPLATVMDFGPAGTWTLDASNGGCTLLDGAKPGSGFGMEMTPETFSLMWAKVRNPVMLMVTRKIRVHGRRHMGEFQKMFPEPAHDVQWPMVEGIPA